MTLPAMKIYTGGDREYSERVQRALFEFGAVWVHNHQTMVTNTSQPWILVGSFERNTLTATDERGIADHIKTAYRIAPNGNLVPQEADDKGWIEWGGGECPVEFGTIVDVKHRECGGIFYSVTAGKFEAKAWGFASDCHISHYRVPSQVFPTSQREPEPVHQMRHGDYILREDIPDEATYRAVLRESERQGFDVIRETREGFKYYHTGLFVKTDIGVGRMGAMGFKDFYRRITPDELGITTQEADMTPCEKKGLREGQWVWFVGIPEQERDAEWVRLDEDDASIVPYFRSPSSRHRWCLDLDNHIDWQAGIHNEKPDTEDSMSETLTEAEALREVAQGYDDGDKNPWERIEWKSSRDAWAPVGGPRSFGVVLSDGDTLRRKPRTVRIEGKISEEAFEFLKGAREIPADSQYDRNFDAAVDEILSTVQDQ